MRLDKYVKDEIKAICIDDEAGVIYVMKPTITITWLKADYSSEEDYRRDVEDIMKRPYKRIRDEYYYADDGYIAEQAERQLYDGRWEIYIVDCRKGVAKVVKPGGRVREIDISWVRKLKKRYVYPEGEKHE